MNGAKILCALALFGASPGARQRLKDTFLPASATEATKDREMGARTIMLQCTMDSPNENSLPSSRFNLPPGCAPKLWQSSISLNRY
jgi:hypothetical protein